MKKLYFLFLVLFFNNFTFAQNDANAKKVLDAVSSKMKTFKGVTASFSLKSLTSKGKINGVKKGSVSFKGQKYLLKQDKTEILCDGAKVYTYDATNKTLTIASVEEGGQTLSPQNLLSNFYDKDFTYKLVSSEGSFHEIELIPNDKKKNFQNIHVFVDKSKSMIIKARVIDKSSNTIEFALSDLNTAAVISDNIFVYDRNRYPKDVEILD
jgi:outer membrane lipoprotein-sorting protein